MPKFQFIKMDDEIEKITSSSPVRITGKFNKYSSNLSSCSIKLFLVRLMLLSMFSCFCFFVYKLALKKSLLEVNVFKSHRLLNEKNIHQINNLEISLNIEHSKFVHLKISDKDNKRWEVPKDLLNPEFTSGILCACFTIIQDKVPGKNSCTAQCSVAWPAQTEISGGSGMIDFQHAHQGVIVGNPGQKSNPHPHGYIGNLGRPIRSPETYGHFYTALFEQPFAPYIDVVGPVANQLLCAQF